MSLDIQQHLTSLVTERRPDTFWERIRKMSQPEFRRAYAEANYPKTRPILVIGAAAIFLTLILAMMQENLSWQTAAFMLGYVGATLVWCFVMALAVRWGLRLLKPIVFRWVTFACSASLLIFGVTLAWSTFQPLFS